MFDPSRVDSKIAAEVRDFDPSGVIDRKEMRRMDRYIQFGLVVARQALDQAGLPGRMDGALAERTGVILGSGLGGVATLFDNVLLMAERGPDRISPFFIPMGIANVGSGQVAIAFGMLGPNFATVSACATGAHAIGEAWETIRRDDADVMLAGGTEAAIHEAVVGGFASMKALSTRNDDPEAASRPFDQGRDGFVIGEGAGMLDPRGAGARGGARRHARSPSSSATARPRTRSTSRCPRPAAPARSARAGEPSRRRPWQPEEIDHVNAHATSTPEGDGAELQALSTLLGEHAPGVSISAQKSMLGHTLGAAGAIESVATIQAMREGAVPPTINLQSTRPERRTASTSRPNKATRRPIRAALNNSFGFGGQNAALVFRRWDG